MNERFQPDKIVIEKIEADVDEIALGADEARQERTTDNSSRRRRLSGARLSVWLKKLKPSLWNAEILAGVSMLAIFGFLAVLIWQVFHPKVFIEQIIVPKDLEERGFKSEVAAKKLQGAIKEINKEAEKFGFVGSFAKLAKLPKSNSGTNPYVTQTDHIAEIVVPGTGVSVGNIVNMAREFFNLADKRIAGEIVGQSNKGYSLVLRVNEEAIGNAIALPINFENFENSFADAAIEILREIAPVSLAKALAVRVSLSQQEDDSKKMDDIHKLSTNVIDQQNEQSSNLLSPLAYIGYLMRRNDDKRDLSNAHLLNGFYYAERGDDNKAFIEYMESVKNDDQNFVARKALAFAFLLTEQFENSLGEFNEALNHISFDDKKTASESHKYMAIVFKFFNQPERALNELLTAQELDWRDPETHFLRGRYLKDSEEAIKEYREAINLKPTQPETREMLCGFLIDLKRYDESLVECRKAADLAPKRAQPHYILGTLFIVQDKRKEASVEFKRAIRLDHDNLARLYEPILTKAGFKVPEVMRAADDIRKKAENLYTDGRKLEAETTKPNAETKIEDAIRKYRAAIKLVDEKRYHFQLGGALEKKGEIDWAVSEYRKAIDDKAPAAYRVQLAGALRAQGKFDEAIVEIKKAIKADPGNAEAHDAYGEWRREHNWINEAIAEYSEAIKFDRNNTATYYTHLATAYEQQKNDIEAKKARAKADELDKRTLRQAAAARKK